MHFKPEYSIAFKTWLDRPAGKRFVDIESYSANQIVETIYGYDAVILGEENFSSCLDKCIIKNQTILNHNLPNSSHKSVLPVICSRQDKLPIATDAIDLVYLAHCLEFNNNPHEVLREAHRILRPDGHLIIAMFNPISLWGFYRHFAKFYSLAPWRANFMSLAHLKDWLALLGFDIMRVNHFGFCLPVGQCKSAPYQPTFVELYGQKLGLPCGAAYIVEASKRVLPLTPIKPAWALEDKVAVEDAAEPTV